MLTMETNPTPNDPQITSQTTWPIFEFIRDQVGNLIPLGIIIMVAVLIIGVILWVSGASSDGGHRKVVAGKVMVIGSIVGAIAIAAAPAIIQWASQQNPIS